MVPRSRSRRSGRRWDALVLGGLAGVLLSLVVGIADRSAVAAGARRSSSRWSRSPPPPSRMVLASQLSAFTGGEDGITYRTPELFKTATKLMVDDDGKVAAPLRGEAQRQARGLLLRVRHLARPVRGPAAHRRLAARDSAEGDPRERGARRGDRLPRRRLSHLRVLHRRRHRVARRARSTPSGSNTPGPTPRSASRS